MYSSYWFSAFAAVLHDVQQLPCWVTHLCSAVLVTWAAMLSICLASHWAYKHAIFHTCDSGRRVAVLLKSCCVIVSFTSQGDAWPDFFYCCVLELVFSAFFYFPFHKTTFTLLFRALKKRRVTSCMHPPLGNWLCCLCYKHFTPYHECSALMPELLLLPRKAGNAESSANCSFILLDLKSIKRSHSRYSTCCFLGSAHCHRLSYKFHKWECLYQ